jgi:hypothetical protein
MEHEDKVALPHTVRHEVPVAAAAGFTLYIRGIRRTLLQIRLTGPRERATVLVVGVLTARSSLAELPLRYLC